MPLNPQTQQPKDKAILHTRKAAEISKLSVNLDNMASRKNCQDAESPKNQTRWVTTAKGNPAPGNLDQDRPAVGEAAEIQTSSLSYRDLLNDMIADARGREMNHELALSGGQIDASLWSAREKYALFGALERYGAGDLPRLARAVHTKSQFEIQVYVSLLREGLELQHKSDPRTATILSDIPAADEISTDCEAALNNAADALSSRVEKHEQTAEREKHDGNWLVDTEAAEQDEQNYEQAVANATTTNVSTADAVDSICSDQAYLLRQPAFLQLSRNLFMNNGEQEDLNWHRVNLVTDVVNEPAIFRRALDDLQAITISLTRRLVQVSIFQAMTRLRASDSTRAEWTPFPAVREIDVRTAVEILRLRPKWQHYWTSVPRRSRVTVYSDSAKYNDGRPGTKAGHALTFDEAEAELGVERKTVGADIEESGDEIFEEDVDELMADSEAFTDESDQSEIPHKDGAPKPKQRSAMFGASRKRKRAVTPDTHAQLQDEHAEVLDSERSRREEMRLWGLLRLTPPESLMNSSNPNAAPPIAPTVLPVGAASAYWRNSVGVQAEWELERGPPTFDDFRNVETEGCARRKRRRIVEDKVRKRLEPCLDDDDSGVEEDESAAGEDDGTRQTITRSGTVVTDSGSESLVHSSVVKRSSAILELNFRLNSTPSFSQTKSLGTRYKTVVLRLSPALEQAVSRQFNYDRVKASSYGQYYELSLSD
ncbi:hypothetical protein CERZMDRAFT_96635 [Cercospora zeae-maydis SCOH1-5]|uniref:Myb-like domain-containing protein n=1 Tax=Cercospora zeae-maydis SCOH1-5 TaxID=717836 RepID=A0A6A6FHX7_9PEZI|nr:hypothetical protein CERZMDRAFT_96635 [Cercospora zeae-maydis SCOH1-5]